jgi:hypothetical protein
MLRLGGILLLLAGVARADSAADAEAMMARGEEYFAKGNYEAAIGIFNAARVLAPDRPDPILWLGLAHAAAQQCKEAIPLLDQYLKLKKGEPKPEALRALAACWPAVSPSAPAKLSIATSPAGAEVRIDAPEMSPIGVTPLDGVALAPGAHMLFLRKEGFQPLSKNLRAEPGAVISLELALQPLAVSMSSQNAERGVARDKLGLVRKLEISGWVMTGLMVSSGVTSGALALSVCSNSASCGNQSATNDTLLASGGVGGGQLLAHVASGAITGLGGVKAREAQRSLGLVARPSPLWTTGWVVWGLGLGESLATLAAAGASYNASAATRPDFGAAALVSTLVNAVGELLLQVDLMRERRRLEAALGPP